MHFFSGGIPREEHMSRIYICSFDEKKPLSYYHDWRDAFERNGFDILNLNANFVHGISRLCRRYEIIVIGYSMYYRLGRKRGGRHQLLHELMHG